MDELVLHDGEPDSEDLSEKEMNREDITMPNDGMIVKQPEYNCPLHGDIGHSTMTSYMEGLEKTLCLRCYIEKLVEIGVCEVTEKKS
jgi:hypothetical protein